MRSWAAPVLAIATVKAFRVPPLNLHAPRIHAGAGRLVRVVGEAAADGILPSDSIPVASSVDVATLPPASLPAPALAQPDGSTTTAPAVEVASAVGAPEVVPELPPPVTDTEPLPQKAAADAALTEGGQQAVSATTTASPESEGAKQAVSATATAAPESEGAKPVTASASEDRPSSQVLKDLPVDTSAAEKVLTLFELGLVDKSDLTGYYDAMVGFESASREKPPILGDAMPGIPPGVGTSTNTGQAVPWDANALSFAAVCATLGGLGAHSLPIPPAVEETVATPGGALLGVAVGLLLALRDDVVGRVARGLGATLAEAVASSLGKAGGEAVDMARNAPARAVSAVSERVAEQVAAAVSAIAQMPSTVLQKVVDATVGTARSASQTLVEEALVKPLASAKTAVTVNVTPQKAVEAGKVLKGLPKTLGGFTSSLRQGKLPLGRATSAGPGFGSTQAKDDVEAQVAAVEEDVREVVTPQDAKEEQERLRKLQSLQESLAKFDKMKERIKTSGTSRELREALSKAKAASTLTQKEAPVRSVQNPAAPVSEGKAQAGDSASTSAKRGAPSASTSSKQREPEGKLREPESDIRKDTLEKEAARRKQVAGELLRRVATTSRDAQKDGRPRGKTTAKTVKSTTVAASQAPEMEVAVPGPVAVTGEERELEQPEVQVQAAADSEAAATPAQEPATAKCQSSAVPFTGTGGGSSAAGAAQVANGVVAAAVKSAQPATAA